jgi:hypothetical protein
MENVRKSMLDALKQIDNIVEVRNADFIDVADELERIQINMENATDVTQLAKLLLEAREQVDLWNSYLDKGKIELPESETQTKPKKQRSNSVGRVQAEHSVKK